MIARNDTLPTGPEHDTPAPCPAAAATGTASFTPMAESALWELQEAMLAREPCLPAEVEGPQLAEAYAAMAMAFWRDCRAAGRLDPGQPLCVLALGSGHGTFVWQLLVKLLPRLKGSEFAAMGLRCQLCDASAARLAALARHPEMAELCRQGLVELVHWDGVTAMPPAGKVRSLQPNPPLVLANDFFGRLRQEWYQIFFGKLFPIEVALAESTADGQEAADAPPRLHPFADLDLLVRCGEKEEELDAAQPHQALRRHYRERLDNTVLTLPTGALSCLHRLQTRFHGRLLLMATDYGHDHEGQLRSRGLPEFAGPGAFALPVNFHALTMTVNGWGGCALRHQPQANGRIFWAAVCGLERERLANSRRAFGEKLVPFADHHPGPLVRLLADRPEQLAPGMMLLLLRQGGHDPETLRLLLPSLLAHRDDLGPEERLDWLDALKQCWQHYWPTTDADDLSFDLGLLAMDLGAWGLAARCFETVLSLFGEHPDSLYNLALALTQAGETRRPLALARQAQGIDSTSEDLTAMLGLLEEQQKSWAKHPWYARTLSRDGQLRLVPMAEQHAPAFWYQYRDPTIGILTRLPDFADGGELCDWIREQGERRDHALCAVLHQEYGFVGSVAMSWQAERGFFYFWIGADYQGRGFGQQAAKLLFAMLARTVGIEAVYTSAYWHNHRSRQALTELGFATLPFKATEPDEDLVFYRLGREETAEATVHEELQALLADTDSPIVLLEARTRDRPPSGTGIKK